MTHIAYNKFEQKKNNKKSKLDLKICNAMSILIFANHIFLQMLIIRLDKKQMNGNNYFEYLSVIGKCIYNTHIFVYYIVFKSEKITTGFEKVQQQYNLCIIYLNYYNLEAITQQYKHFSVHFFFIVLFYFNFFIAIFSMNEFMFYLLPL